MQFALIGNPIDHSLSPQLFRAAYGGAYHYGLLHAANVAEAMQLFTDKALRGVNVTAPFKRDVLAYADVCSEEVEVLGAANTLVRQLDGCIKAYNTDICGVVNSLFEKVPSLANHYCLVVGAGGAGVAAAYGLKQQQARVVVANRTVEKAQLVAESLGVEFCSLSDLPSILPSVAVVVNTVSSIDSVVDSSQFHSSQVFLDASYVGSGLLNAALEAGCTCMDGRYWLLHQAIVAYKLFTGAEPNVDAMRSMLAI